MFVVVLLLISAALAGFAELRRGNRLAPAKCFHGSGTSGDSGASAGTSCVAGGGGTESR